MDKTTEQSIKRMAEKLAALNREWEESIEEIYWFPHDSEIRLVEVDPNAPPGGDMIAPFYFRADPANGITLPSGIAIINPRERAQLSPPEQWGDWKSAVRIWPAEAIQ